MILLNIWVLMSIPTLIAFYVIIGITQDRYGALIYPELHRMFVRDKSDNVVRIFDWIVTILFLPAFVVYFTSLFLYCFVVIAFVYFAQKKEDNDNDEI